MTVRRSLALTAAVLCLVAGACSSDDSDDEPSSTTSADATTSTTSTTTEADTTVPDDGCTWLHVEDATAAMGTPMTLAAAGEAGCLFTPDGGDGPGIQISVIEIAIDVDEYLAGSRDVCEGPIVDVDNGDAAWACDSGINPQAVVAFGTELVVADITDTDSPAAGLPLAAAVAAVLEAG